MYNILQYSINIVMNENPTFSEAITQYISMALHIWPALQLSLAHIQESVAPPQGSAIRPRNYTSMSSEQFMQAMTKDLHDFIMEHDVKTEHIVDFLDDILAIFNAEQENDKTMNHMASQLVLLIGEVPDGNYTRLVNFRFVYNALKGKNLGHVVQQPNQQSYSEGSSENQQDFQQQMQQQNSPANQAPETQTNKIQQEVPQLTGEEKQNLEDDGWVIIKKKGKK